MAVPTSLLPVLSQAGTASTTIPLLLHISNGGAVSACLVSDRIPGTPACIKGMVVDERADRGTPASCRACCKQRWQCIASHVGGHRVCSQLPPCDLRLSQLQQWAAATFLYAAAVTAPCYL